MSIPDSPSKKFTGKYIRGYRACDGPNCTMTKKLGEHETGLDYKVYYCSFHHNDPFNQFTGIRMHINLIKPMSTKEHYQIFTPEGDPICAYVGCKEYKNLIIIRDNFFCKDHGQNIVNLEFKYITDKSNTDNLHDILIDNIKEFNCRKILSHKNLRTIHESENLLMVDKAIYSESTVNMIHLQHLTNNYNIFEEYKAKHPKKFSKDYSYNETIPVSNQIHSIIHLNNNSESSVIINKKYDEDVNRKSNNPSNGSETPTFIKIISKVNLKNIAYQTTLNNNNLNKSTSSINENRYNTPINNFQMIPTIPRARSSPNLSHLNYVDKYPINENPRSFFARDPVDFLNNPNYYKL